MIFDKVPHAVQVREVAPSVATGLPEVLTIGEPKPKERQKPIFNYNFVKGAFLDVQGDPDEVFALQIRNGDKLIHQDVLGGNHYIKAFPQYYIPYNLRVFSFHDGEVIFNHTLDLKDKRVVVELTSGALGDTLAWVPYLSEFQKKHECELVAITYHNELFEKSYPNVKFVTPGAVINDVYAWYEIGWYYKSIEKDVKEEVTDEVNLNKNPRDFKSHPLQQTATDILGLDYTEIKPTLDFAMNQDLHKKITDQLGQKKFVTIAVHGTLQAKYWNNPLGWQEVVDYLKYKGYEVVLLSKEENGSNGNYNPTGVLTPSDYKLDTIMGYLYYSELFIGIGSGLTWLAWALNVPTVLISGFSNDYTEMQTGITRVTAPAGACHGCFNHTRLQNDGNWDWCPVHRNDDKKFECTTTITGQHVIDVITPLLKNS
jgi:autotransporter strand-loop-strand O-heptosyltransferase